MYVQIEKPKENKSRAVANSVAQKKSNVKQGFGFVDNRTAAVAQKTSETQGKTFKSEGRATLLSVTPDAAILQAVFSQTTLGRQQSVHGGVTAGYDVATNTANLHIAAGANADGKLMTDFLTALWEVRDTIVAGQAKNPAVAGGVEMHPGGSQVLKMTMEMLGEAVGQAPNIQTARTAKATRQQNNLPLGAGIPAHQINDVLDSTIVPEHRAYRDSLIGVAGVTMSPIGGGTTGGTVDMLHGAGAANERVLYDIALATLQPFMSISVTITLPILNQVIAMMEGKLTFFQRLALKAKYKVKG